MSFLNRLLLERMILIIEDCDATLYVYKNRELVLKKQLSLNKNPQEIFSQYAKTSFTVLVNDSVQSIACRTLPLVAYHNRRSLIRHTLDTDGVVSPLIGYVCKKNAKAMLEYNTYILNTSTLTKWLNHLEKAHASIHGIYSLAFALSHHFIKTVPLQERKDFLLFYEHTNSLNIMGVMNGHVYFTRRLCLNSPSFRHDLDETLFFVKRLPQQADVCWTIYKVCSDFMFLNEALSQTSLRHTVPNHPLENLSTNAFETLLKNMLARGTLGPKALGSAAWHGQIKYKILLFSRWFKNTVFLSSFILSTHFGYNAWITENTYTLEKALYDQERKHDPSTPNTVDLIRLGRFKRDPLNDFKKVAEAPSCPVSLQTVEWSNPEFLIHPKDAFMKISGILNTQHEMLDPYIHSLMAIFEPHHISYRKHFEDNNRKTSLFSGHWLHPKKHLQTETSSSNFEEVIIEIRD